MSTAKISVEGVSKKFRLQTDRAHSVKELVTRRGRDREVDEFWALSDVSMEIPEGSMYALVGHNGSGKSTLLRCIAGIYRPTRGRVRVDGRISTLLELGAGFHPDLTGRENVYMNATILGMSKRQIDGLFDDIVGFAGVEEFIDSPVKIYSSGMYVRLGFSVAVHVDPEILIIDEVIAVGDQEFQNRCYDHLYGLRRKGVTIVVVTHGMATVETMCDGAAWLDHGHLLMDGPAPEVAAAYVQRVNDKEMALRAAAHAVAAEQADDLAPGVEPWFGEDLEITDVWFTSREGDSNGVAVAGEPLTLHVGYRAHRPVEEPVIGYSVHSENDVVVAGNHTRASGFDTGELSGEGEVRFSLDSLPLTPGNYRFTVAVTDRYLQHTFDRHFRRHALTVRRGEGQSGVGFIELTGRWEVLPGGAGPAASGRTGTAPVPGVRRD